MVLAVDYGLKRTGLAISDEENVIAEGLETCPTIELIDRIKNLIEDRNVDTLLVGMPYNLSGGLNIVEENIKSFISLISKEKPQLRIERIDERFTSKIASQEIFLAKLKKKKRREKGLIDKISATIILQNYLDNLGSKPLFL